MRENEWERETSEEGAGDGILDEEIDSIRIKLDDYNLAEEEPDGFPGEDELFASLNDSLRRQVEEIGEEDRDASIDEAPGEVTREKMSRKKKVLLVFGSIVLVLVLTTAFLAGTRPGQKLVLDFIARFIDDNINHEDDNILLTLTPGIDIPDNPDDPNDDDDIGATPLPTTEPHLVRNEDYVKNFLIFGIDQGDMDAAHSGSLNTDTMMIATINTKTKSVMLTSILRDMYVELEDGKGRKLNSVYARGARSGQGPELLMSTIEKYFRIDLEGYAYVKLASFEKIVDLLGGVSIKITAEEARYLNKTNYITNPANRNLKEGVNWMNGNQAVGYCRVRKVATLGGATNDYGRTLRQRRVLQAIFEKYKSQNVFNLFSVTKNCLSHVTTNLTVDQIEELLEIFVYNGISTMESFRLPINDSFYDSGIKGHNGVTYGLVITDPGANVRYLFENLYGDTPEEAVQKYNELDK